MVADVPLPSALLIPPTEDLFQLKVVPAAELVAV